MPVKYSQAGRLLSLATPLGEDVLLLERLQGTEAISELFRFELNVLALASTTIAFDQLLGQSVTVQVQLPNNQSRFFNGIVSRLAQGDRLSAPPGGESLIRYTLEVVPKLWLLTRRAQSRIFQQMAVPDILKQVLNGLDITWEIQGTFEPRDYCVQYRETDFAFATRLMEEEGIYYYFKHANGSHQMVVANTPQSHVSVPGPETISYQPGAGGVHPDDRIMHWQKAQEIRSGKVTLWDHCFELPGQNLEAVKPVTDSVSVGTVTHKLKVGGNDQLEIYDYPGLYAQRFDGVAPGGRDCASDVQKIFQDNTRTATIRIEQQTVEGVRVTGSGNVRHLSAGHKFTLADHFDANGAYVLTRVTHDATLEGVYTGGSVGTQTPYTSRFECIPLALPFRPQMLTPRPHVPGPQTATVVGPSGEEIFTDKYGRVKVQFHWDRVGTKDANSSCWVRVGSIWAGKQWGAIHIPRIGQEVIVAFEEGDPDRPIIVGSVYNAENMPPYTLPDNRTQSGIKSRSSLNGNAETFNELRFEDKKDSEEIYFHAEKDFNRVVENNDTLKVGFEKQDKGDQTIEIFNNQSLKVGAGTTDAEDGSQTIDIFNNQTLTVGSGQGQNADGSQTISVYKNRTATIETGDETLTVKQGNRLVEVSTGDDTHNIMQGNRAVEIAVGNDTLTIKTGNQTTKLDLGASSTEAMQSIELKVGQNSIKIDQTGITLQGMMVKIQGQAQVQVAGPITQVNGDGMLQLKGGVTTIN